MNHMRRLCGMEKPLVRVLPLVGSIKAGRGGKNLNITNLEKQIAQTFDCKRTKPKAVVLDINSMGGSAVQSNLIYTRIRNLASKNNLPVISYIQDAGVSGGYWLALAGDEILADPNSSVGSIGALSLLFGIEDVLKKLGVEPRIINSGKFKLRINPFGPESPENVAWVKKNLSEVHESFKNLVKERRKSLQADHDTVFEADVFTGRNAVKIGLIDGTTSDIDALMKERFGDNVVIKRMEAKSRFPFGFGKVGAEVKFDTDDIIDGLADAQTKFRIY